MLFPKALALLEAFNGKKWNGSVQNWFNHFKVGDLKQSQEMDNYQSLVNKKKKKIEMVSRHQTPFFLANLRVLNLKKKTLTFPWLATVFAVQKCLDFIKKHFFICFLTDSNISQNKIVETSQFIFKPFSLSQSDSQSLKIIWLNIPRPTSIFIKSFKKTFVNIRTMLKKFLFLDFLSCSKLFKSLLIFQQYATIRFSQCPWLRTSVVLISW